MPLQTSLKINLKKNKRGKILFLLLFLVFFSKNLAAITVEMNIALGSNLTIFQNIQELDKELLFNSLGQGFQSEIFIQVLLYKKRSQPYSWFGDELIQSLDIRKNAKMDIFSDCFRLSSNEGVSFFSKESDFIEHYLKSRIFIPLDNIEVNDISSYYIKTRTTLIKKLYLQPFNILYLFNLKNRISTGWIINEI